MKLAYFLGPICALALNATGAVVIQSVSTNWNGTIRVERAITLGGGVDTAGSSGSTTDPNYYQAFGGHAKVGPDFADIDGNVSVMTSEEGVRARCAFSAFGQVEQPQAADYGVIWIDVTMFVDIVFVLDSPAEIGLGTVGYGEPVYAAILNENHSVGYLQVYGNESRTATLPAGVFVAHFVFYGVSQNISPQGVPARYAYGEYQLSVPSPGVLALSVITVVGRRRRRCHGC